LALFALFSILSHGCFLIVILLLAQTLGPDQFGKVAFALALQTYGFLIGSLGIKPVVVREGAADAANLDRVFTAHFLLTGVGSVSVCLVTLATLEFVPVHEPERLLLSLLAIGNVATCLNIQPFFDVYHQQAKSSAIHFAAESATLGVIVWLRQAGRLDLVSVGAALAFRWTASAVGHYLVYHFSIRRLRFTLCWTTLGLLVQSSWPLLISTLVAIVPLSAGVVVVRLLADETSAALLGLGQHAASAYVLVVVLGIRFAQPFIAGPGGLEPESVRKMVLGFGWFLVVLWVGASLASAGVVVGWLEPAYRDAVWPTLILLLAAFVKSVGNAASIYLVVLREEGFVLLANGCVVGVYVIGCMVLVSRFSYLGAAWLSVGSAALATLLIVGRVRHRLTRRESRGRSQPRK
jgi:O-antigen/teichoic acid export membrane protein